MSATDSAQQPKPVRSSGLGALVLLLVLAAAAAGLFLVFWEMDHAKAPPPEPPAVQREVVRLQARLVLDEKRIAALETGAQRDVGAQGEIENRLARMETASDLPARLDVDERHLTDMDVRLAALEHAAPASDLQQRLAAAEAGQAGLAARLAALEGKSPVAQQRLAAIELALANLVRADASGPFAVEWKAFGALVPGAPEANALARIAPRGAPTRVALAARFPDIAARALAAERAGAAKTWLGRLWANLGNVVVVRRIGETRGQDSEAVLARAGVRLNEGELGAAIAEVQSLKGPARRAAQPWLNDAQDRLTVERATAALSDRVAALLAAP